MHYVIHTTLHRIYYIFIQKISIIKFILGNNQSKINKINLCCGSQKIPEYFGVDIDRNADLQIDLSKNNLPLKENSLDAVICISAINYFTRHRGQEIINEVYRVLKHGGIARFGVQDLQKISQLYLEKNNEFFFQKLPNGSERFEGITIGDKFAAWFYGYVSNGTPCKYFYDYDSLAVLFRNAGFSIIQNRPFGDSQLTNIELIDNRKDQMFFLEAIK